MAAESMHINMNGPQLQNGCSYICVWKHNGGFAIKLFLIMETVVKFSLMAVTTQLWTPLWYTSVHQDIKVVGKPQNL